MNYLFTNYLKLFPYKYILAKVILKLFTKECPKLYIGNWYPPKLAIIFGFYINDYLKVVSLRFVIYIFNLY